MQKLFESKTQLLFFDGVSKIKITNKAGLTPACEFDIAAIDFEILKSIALLKMPQQKNEPSSDNEKKKVAKKK